MGRGPRGWHLAIMRSMLYILQMTKLEVSLEVSDRLAREAREAGLLAPEALAELIESGVRRKAIERIRAANTRPGGDAPMTLKDLQAIVAEVRGSTC